MSIFSKKTKELNFLREQNRKLIERIGEKNTTIALYEDEIIKRDKQIYELESYIESCKPKRSPDGKFASKNEASQSDNIMKITRDKKTMSIFSLTPFTTEIIIDSAKKHLTGRSFKSLKITVENNG